MLEWYIIPSVRPSVGPTSSSTNINKIESMRWKGNHIHFLSKMYTRDTLISSYKEYKQLCCGSDAAADNAGVFSFSRLMGRWVITLKTTRWRQCNDEDFLLSML